MLTTPLSPWRGVVGEAFSLWFPTFRHIVIRSLAAFGRESQGVTHYLVPLFFGQSVDMALPCNAQFQHAEDKSGVEIVACPNGANGLCVANGIAFAKAAVGT